MPTTASGIASAASRWVPCHYYPATIPCFDRSCATCWPWLTLGRKHIRIPRELLGKWHITPNHDDTVAPTTQLLAFGLVMRLAHRLVMLRPIHKHTDPRAPRPLIVETYAGGARPLRQALAPLLGPGGHLAVSLTPSLLAAGRFEGRPALLAAYVSGHRNTLGLLTWNGHTWSRTGSLSEPPQYALTPLSADRFRLGLVPPVTYPLAAAAGRITALPAVRPGTIPNWILTPASGTVGGPVSPVPASPSAAGCPTPGPGATSPSTGRTRSGRPHYPVERPHRSQRHLPDHGHHPRPPGRPARPRRRLPPDCGAGPGQHQPPGTEVLDPGAAGVR
ncbi:protein of unknown function [Candidatus Hydrogenisulfobacillus filiaventi]|uniref:Uncharacterized protein n=1 Tax=Candidatus Hydrogenisulfobacillus filiaventi TaxID=2707344 RepID=A0A6F8ZIH4_9FIRM|nr:protein of unknown function [Candidatus Hydrogenisulfobacillus filiaventi]